MPTENEIQRHIGDNDQVRCGDVLHDHCHRTDNGTCGLSRRLCGTCSRVVDLDDDRRELANETGCGDVLEDWRTPPAGWEDRVIDQARQAGVIDGTTR